MFTIGEFAKHGSVSVRMLRHYDTVGLLHPARTDPATGYRFYAADQLARLNRVIALKDLGFTLDQVRSILDERVSAEELRGMLRLRRAELEAAQEAAAQRLGQVEARLRMIEGEGHMPSEDVVVKKLPPVRVAELTATAGGFEPKEIGPVIRPLYGRLCRGLEEAGLVPTGPGIAYYDESAPGDSVIVHAAMPVSAPEGEHARGFTVRDLPGADAAATLVHRGSMDRVMPAVQTLARWIDDNGYRPDGSSRELYLDCSEEPERWVTELQQPVSRA